MSVFAPVLQQHNVAEGSADDQEEADEQQPVVGCPSANECHDEQKHSRIYGSHAEVMLVSIDDVVHDDICFLPCKISE